MSSESKASVSPTTDLLARLRVGDICADPCRMMEARSGCLCAAAADEIERLRGALAEIAKATDAGAYFTARRIAAETIEGNDHG